MIIPAVVLISVTLQQPQQPSPAARAARLAAYDTSRAVLSHVSRPVAEVKSALDVYRRAVFNGTDEDVLHNADYLRSSCEAVDTTARIMAPKVCQHCAERDAQAAFDGYRQMLPSLRRGVAHCAAQVWALERRPDAAKRLRQDVRVIGNPLIATLRFYESRLGAVLKAINVAGATQPPPVQARPRPAPRP